MSQPVNQIELTGTLVEAKPLSYTPAGIAVFEARFYHASEQYEAGGLRKVQFEFVALGFEDIAIRLSQLKPDQSIQIQGFIAHRSVRNSKLTVHITEFKI